MNFRRLLAMAFTTQRLQGARNEGVPVTTMLFDVINFDRDCVAPSCLTGSTQGLALQLLAPDGSPDRHPVPGAPMALMRICTGARHECTF